MADDNGASLTLLPGEYRDLNIEVAARPDGHVELRSAGLKASSWHDPADLRRARNVMQLPRVGGEEDGEYVSWSSDYRLRQQELGQALYAGDIGSELQRMLGDEPGVRVCLHPADPFTASLPWECARLDDEASAFPVALDARACVVRRHDSAGERSAPRDTTTAVVAFAADPCGPCALGESDRAHAGPCRQRLADAEREAETIAASLTTLLGRKNVLCLPATRQRLTAACEEPVAVFVFVGHGGFPGRDMGRSSPRRAWSSKARAAPTTLIATIWPGSSGTPTWSLCRPASAATRTSTTRASAASSWMLACRSSWG